ncbi:hypothetical protein ACIQM4_25005 [Streptomyces sp. NPDC091272]|uniref:hypothetical protein n=1 Tax=Streptomyces sp. NPDC091272 TaxID=3365981 RepID=UPI003815BAD5
MRSLIGTRRRTRAGAHAEGASSLAGGGDGSALVGDEMVVPGDGGSVLVGDDVVVPGDGGSVLVEDDGVTVGHDAGGRALLLGLHRSVPYDITLIGGLWTAQILALRAEAAGIHVAVETARAHAWERMGARADTANGVDAGAGRPRGQGDAGTGRPSGPSHAGTGRSSGPSHAGTGTPNGPSHAGTGRPSHAGTFALFDVGRVPVLGAGEGRPVLVVRDCGMRPPRGRVVPAAWQSVLTLLPYLSPVAPRLVRDSALVGVQRVSPDEVQQLGRLLALTQEEADALPGLGDGVTLWCAGRERQWVTTTAVGGESALAGPARRMD